MTIAVHIITSDALYHLKVNTQNYKHANVKKRKVEKERL